MFVQPLAKFVFSGVKFLKVRGPLENEPLEDLSEILAEKIGRASASSALYRAPILRVRVVRHVLILYYAILVCYIL